ncbi:unnamed protein product [Symbiodinium natans]|uniref:Uncharacterized protein n=1 Tax=Symbiodinium natans TaxID=878477 RepID=A0A812R4F2_9DINO|nr:unnamed protein product [Symbiodinium natans]
MQQAWRALEPPSGRRLQSGRQIAYRHTMATLAYYKEDGGNLLEERSLFAIRNYERTLQATAEWQFFCGNAIVGIQEATAAPGNATNQTVTEAASTPGQQISCAPGESLVNYIWPSYDSPSGISVGPGETQQLLMDGTGSRFFPVEAVVSALRDGTDRLPQTMNRLARLFPKDFVAPEGGERPHTDTLRSFFLFSQAYGPDGYYDSSSAAGVDRQRFHGGDLHNLLRRQDTVLQESGIRVFYSSGLLDEADIFSALFADVMLSVGGLTGKIVPRLGFHTGTRQQEWALPSFLLATLVFFLGLTTSSTMNSMEIPLFFKDARNLACNVAWLRVPQTTRWRCYQTMCWDSEAEEVRENDQVWPCSMYPTVSLRSTVDPPTKAEFLLCGGELSALG